MPSRLETLEAAARRTRHVLDDLGVTRTPAAPDARPLSAILLCRGGRLTALAVAAGSDVDVLCAMSAPVAVEFLLSRRYDALVVDAPSLGLDASVAVELVRRNPALAEVPILAVGPAYEADDLISLGASAVVSAADLEDRLATFGTAYRRLQALRAELRALKSIATHSELGVPDRAILQAHLDEIERAAEADVALGVLEVRIEDAPAPPRMLQAVAALIRTLTRAEDVIAELEPGVFGMLFPGASGHDADKVVARLAAVTSSSAVLGTDGVARQPQVEHAVVPLTQGATGPNLWQHVEGRLARGRRTAG